jgi:uncharacterized membrane protein (DUF4010 family)
MQLAAVLAATSRLTLYQMRFPLIAGGVAALAYGLFFMFLSARQTVAPAAQKGRAFSLKTAVLFAALIAGVLLLSAGLNAWLGRAGVLAAAAVAGLADTHAAAVSVASLVSAGKLSAQESVLPILAALTSNTVSKMVIAISSGGRYALQIIPGLLIVICAAWVAALVR